MEELKLQTPVPVGRSRVEVSPDDKICVLGSCFADNIGDKMADLGFNACVNPFGTLYNPVSVCNSVSRLASGIPFTEDECVEMGSGAGLVCSFSHHTSFARSTAEEFLDHANTSLAAASKAWNEAGKVIITLGTAWCFEYIPTGEIVSNCLKID
ncbi:MAG: GSCFA domain-containing protein, partial [Bacteroidales bacterium]|nr:GSCFA domain-containing protein [Bacteroidales bacterium]